MQNLFMENLENRSGLFGEFHALIVEVGKNHCKKRAICEDCPIILIHINLVVKLSKPLQILQYQQPP